MATIRFKALEELFARQPLKIDLPANKTSEYYGVNVFDKRKMKDSQHPQADFSEILATDERLEAMRYLVLGFLIGN